MVFSEKIKLDAKEKAHFRCCICYKKFVEVHHITPQADGGSDLLENAAPLCASCHDLYGGNPEKRKQIKQMRDHLWTLVAEMEEIAIKTKCFDSLILNEDPNYQEKLKEKAIAIYHVIYETEGFEEAAQDIFLLIKSAQEKDPNKRRILYLDIEGHRNEFGGYDHDMFEIQRYFIMEFMAKYLSEIHLPIIGFKTKQQDNDIPPEIKIFENKEKALEFKEKFPDADLNPKSIFAPDKI